VEAFVALAAFAVLCAVVLSSASRLVEPDDYAYRASIVAITQGHFLTLSTAQADRLAAQLPGPGGHPVAARPGGNKQGAGSPGGNAPVPAVPVPVVIIPQWVQLSDGRWISEKDPGYPFLAAPFQAAGIIRLAPLFYGALGGLGLFFGARRWLGRYGGPAAVVLFWSSGAALLFAWRDYMPTFTDASLIAPNLRYMPAHLIQAMPMLVLGLAALAWIAGRGVRLRRAEEERAVPARRDLAVGLALAASWFSVWGLYAAYTWTASPFGSTLQFARFYVPAIGAISLLGSWLVTRLPRRASPAAVTSAAVAVAIFGLGAWSFAVIR